MTEHQGCLKCFKALIQGISCYMNCLAMGLQFRIFAECHVTLYKQSCS